MGVVHICLHCAVFTEKQHSDVSLAEYKVEPSENSIIPWMFEEINLLLSTYERQTDSHAVFNRIQKGSSLKVKSQ